MKRASRSDWQTKPMPERQATIGLDRIFSPEEMLLVERGVIPEQMEDKWFIFHEDDTLYFHRSWTGFCMYVVHFDRGADGARATHAEVNRDPEQYSETDDDRDKALLNHLIDVLLLSRRSSYPTGSDGEGTNPLAQWGFIGRAMFGDGDEVE